MTSSTKSKSTIARRLGLGGAAVGAGLAVAVLTAPTASAGVTSINVAPGASFGSTPYGTGCSYTITATVNDNAAPVYFYDNNLPIGTGPASVSGAAATVTWTPTTPGSHVLVAYQFVNPPFDKTTQVTVGNGINLGSSCVVL